LKNKFRSYIIIAFAVCTISCDIFNPYYAKNFEDKLKTSIKNQIEKKGKARIVIKDLTDFDWDYFFCVSPYSELSRVENITNIDVSILKKTRIRYRDDINVLVFIKSDKITKYIEFPIYFGDFMGLKSENLLFSAKNAIFIVEPKTVILWGKPYKNLIVREED